MDVFTFFKNMAENNPELFLRICQAKTYDEVIRIGKEWWEMNNGQKALPTKSN